MAAWPRGRVAAGRVAAWQIMLVWLFWDMEIACMSERHDAHHSDCCSLRFCSNLVISVCVLCLHVLCTSSTALSRVASARTAPRRKRGKLMQGQGLRPTLSLLVSPSQPCELPLPTPLSKTNSKSFAYSHGSSAAACDPESP